MEAVDVRGRFVWHQLMTRNVPGAKNFYSKLVGWKTTPWPLDPAYTVCQVDAGPVAGIMAIPADLPADVPAHWVQYIATRDVDGTVDAAVRAGGSVMKAPSDMQGAGRYAVLKDPQGALFAIIDPENARPEPQGPPPHGTFSWHELATTDHEAAFAFYSGLFGWDVMQRLDMGSAGVYLIFGQNGAQRGGMYIPSSVQMPPSWMPYVQVPNADSAHQLATSGGARSLVGPMDVPGGSRIACLLDPAGAAFSVVSTAAATSAESPSAQSSPASEPKAKAARPAARPRPKSKPKAKAKAKTKAKAKMKAGKKPAARKKVAGKSARTSTRRVAKKARRAAPRKKAVARKKSGARRKK